MAFHSCLQNHDVSNHLSNITVVCGTVVSVLKDHPIGHKNVVCQDRWSLVTGSEILKCRSFCRKCVVCQDRWSLMAVVFQERFHCICNEHLAEKKVPDVQSKL